MMPEIGIFGKQTITEHLEEENIVNSKRRKDIYIYMGLFTNDVMR